MTSPLALLPSERLELLEQQFVDQTKKRKARNSLIDFTEYTYARYRTGSHHRIVADQLERVMRRDIDRLMLLLPPRHGKTELASRRYPAYCLGNYPTRQIIAASASESFANDVGREVRNLIRSEEYGRIFPRLQLSDDSQASGRWHTKQGGIFYAVGVGSQILGKGADEFIIDDPFGSMADAQSELERKAVREWYQGSVYNRLQPGGAIILINHRMHEEDLSGYLIDQQRAGGDKWEIVELPAIQDDGSALWPEAYPVESLERIKANSLPRFWSALYQQNPQPDDGTYFKRDWFRRYDDRPEKLTYWGSSDFAVTEGDGDYTEHAVWAVDSSSNIYAIDWWRGQTDASVWIEKWLDLSAKYKPITWFAEGGVIRRAIESPLRRRMDERRIWVTIEWVNSIHDKATRARAFQSLSANGKVLFPNTPWAGDVLDQLVRFPAGKYDDAVDACSLIGRAVDETIPAYISKAVTRRRPTDGYARPQHTGGYKTA